MHFSAFEPPPSSLHVQYSLKHITSLYEKGFFKSHQKTNVRVRLLEDEDNTVYIHLKQITKEKKVSGKWRAVSGRVGVIFIYSFIFLTSVQDVKNGKERLKECWDSLNHIGTL